MRFVGVVWLSRRFCRKIGSVLEARAVGWRRGLLLDAIIVVTE